jgi:hypothetical protein
MNRWEAGLIAIAVFVLTMVGFAPVTRVSPALANVLVDGDCLGTCSGVVNMCGQEHRPLGAEFCCSGGYVFNSQKYEVIYWVYDSDGVCQKDRYQPASGICTYYDTGAIHQPIQRC